MNYHWSRRFEYGWKILYTIIKTPIRTVQVFLISVSAILKRASRTPPPHPGLIYNNVYEIFYCASKLIYTIFSWRLRMWIRYPPLSPSRRSPPFLFSCFYPPVIPKMHASTKYWCHRRTLRIFNWNLGVNISSLYNRVLLQYRTRRDRHTIYLFYIIFTTFSKKEKIWWISNGHQNK